MSIQAILQKAFLEGYATGDLDIRTMFICIGFTSIIGLYVFLIYKLINRNSFYNGNFALSLIALSVITSAIILTIQSNIVVSLGMVGALSIVRFRTAIKDPMDLVFLFWSISVGIICGAGFAMIAVIASIALTVIIILISVLPSEKGTKILVVNASDYNEKEIMNIVSEKCRSSRVRARTVTQGAVNYAIEVKVKYPDQLIDRLMQCGSVVSVSLVEHDGDVTA